MSHVTGLQRRLRQGSLGQVTGRTRMGAPRGHQRAAPHEARTASGAGPMKRANRDRKQKRTETAASLRETRGCTGEKMQALSEKSQACTEEKLWDPSRRQRKSPTRQKPRTEEDSYSRRPGKPNEEESGPYRHVTLLDGRG
ncbi:hypothetical protein NDU88_006027 [Pleurodeles waltl]|uniref:Uncharacterized protein n=1 Tax=Pleurodeles waltl TaxID=8319 RepID=A0AAV7NP26_PLEWA|nr:hypothetical protein NDU88_006027 [Pleurodeles waltl]